MSYSDYGLDEKKVSYEEGSVNKEWLCLWRQDVDDFGGHHVQHGFNLCFQHLTICKECADAATNIENQHRWIWDDCFKCHKKNVIAYSSKDDIPKEGICICKECIDWAKSVLSKPRPVYQPATIEQSKTKPKHNMAQKPLSEKAISELNAVIVEGNVVKLSGGFLDRKIYNEVNRALEGIGGKWTKGKNPGHYFKQDPQPMLDRLLNKIDETGGHIINTKKDFQFFSTPDKLANDVVALADIQPDDLVLEPSAGDGALIRAVNRVHPDKTVMYCELMPLNLSLLESIDTAFFMGTDFTKLKALPLFDKIVANPPFTNGQDIEHIRLMFRHLKPGGTMVTVASRSWMFTDRGKGFRRWIDDANQITDRRWNDMSKEDKASGGFGTTYGNVFIIMVPAGAFKESGTNVATCIIKIKKD